MRISLPAIVIFLLVGQVWAQTSPDAATPIGLWEGESKCAVPDSPCRDEHALYRIMADKKNPAQLNVDGYKIVDGSRQFMGTLVCQYHAVGATLNCTAHTGQQADWEFHVSGDTMTGTLTIGAEKTLYRRITVRRK